MGAVFAPGRISPSPAAHIAVWHHRAMSEPPRQRPRRRTDPAWAWYALAGAALAALAALHVTGVLDRLGP